MIACAQHFREQALGDEEIVVQMRKQRPDVGRECAVGVHLRQYCARRFAVETVSVVNDFRLRTEAGGHRHLPRDRCIQRIDGLDTQSRSVIGEVPLAFFVAFLIALERGAGEAPRRHLFGSTAGNFGVGKGIQNALAHFRRRLAGKSDRDDLLRLIDACQQGEVALDQQRGFSRTGRGAHDEGTCDVDRFATDLLILCVSVGFTHYHFRSVSPPHRG